MSKYIISLFLCTLFAQANATETKYERALALVRLAKQAHRSCDLFERYFKERYNCDVTQAHSYADIKLFLSDTPVDKRSKGAQESLDAITAGPFAPALAKEVELNKARYHVFYAGQEQAWSFRQDFTTALLNEYAHRGLRKPLRKDFLYIKTIPNFLGKKPSCEHRRLSVRTTLLGKLANLDFGNLQQILKRYTTKPTPLNLYKHIFQPFEITQLAERYQKRVEDLYQRLVILKHGGRLLQIAIPENDLLELLNNEETGFFGLNEERRWASIWLAPNYLLNPKSSVKIFAYDAYEYDDGYQAWCTERDKLVVEIVDNVVESRTEIDRLVAGTRGEAVEQRTAAFCALKARAYTSCYGLAQFFKAQYGCDITGLYSYLYIHNWMFRYMYSSRESWKNDVAMHSQIKEALTSIIEGPFGIALAKEVELDEAGYAVFYHGQRQQWAFQQDFTTAFINELARHGLCQPLRNDFLYIQNMPNLLGKNPGEALHHFLSVNIGLLGCTSFAGSCSWMFALNDNNENDIPLNIERDIFQALDIAQLTDKYLGQVMSLRNELAQLKKGGRLLQIAVQKSEICTVFIREDAYHGYPGDHRTEESLCLANDYLLSPASPAKIFAYDAYEHDTEYKEWCAKRNKLIVEMVATIVDNNKPASS